MSEQVRRKLKAALQENARLKAEVERLRLENGAFKRTVNEASAHYDNRLADIARLKAEVERLGEENKKRQKDMELLFASYKQALEDIRRLHWDLQAAKEGKQS